MNLWWVRRGDQTFGPVDETALVNALREGRIQPGDLACREGGQEWLLVSSVPGVAEVFAPKRSQPPPGGGQDPWREAAWMIGNLDGEMIEGPLSLDEVKVLLARGTLTGGELIARVGSSAWQQIPDVMAEYGRATSNRPAPAAVMRTTIPPVPTPTGHPSTPPPRSGSTPAQANPIHAMHATQTQTAPITNAFHAPASSSPIVASEANPSHAPASSPSPSSASMGSPPRPAPRALSTTQTAPRVDGWYFSRAGIPVGPLSHDQLRSAVIAGEVITDTPVCRVDEWVWKPFSAFPELSRRAAPPPLPPRGRTR